MKLLKPCIIIHHAITGYCKKMVQESVAVGKLKINVSRCLLSTTIIGDKDYLIDQKNKCKKCGEFIHEINVNKETFTNDKSRMLEF